VKYEPMTPERRYAIEREAVKQRSLAECWLRTGAMPLAAIEKAALEAARLNARLVMPDPFGRPED
jgi:hypothetical protein